MLSSSSNHNRTTSNQVGRKPASGSSGHPSIMANFRSLSTIQASSENQLDDQLTAIAKKLKKSTASRTIPDLSRDDSSLLKKPIILKIQEKGINLAQALTRKLLDHEVFRHRQDYAKNKVNDVQLRRFVRHFLPLLNPENKGDVNRVNDYFQRIDSKAIRDTHRTDKIITTLRSSLPKDSPWVSQITLLSGYRYQNPKSTRSENTPTTPQTNNQHGRVATQPPPSVFGHPPTPPSRLPSPVTPSPPLLLLDTQPHPQTDNESGSTPAPTPPSVFTPSASPTNRQPSVGATSAHRLIDTPLDTNSGRLSSFSDSSHSDSAAPVPRTPLSQRSPSTPPPPAVSAQDITAGGAGGSVSPVSEPGIARFNPPRLVTDANALTRLPNGWCASYDLPGETQQANICRINSTLQHLYAMGPSRLGDLIHNVRQTLAFDPIQNERKLKALNFVETGIILLDSQPSLENLSGWIEMVRKDVPSFTGWRDAHVISAAEISEFLNIFLKLLDLNPYEMNGQSPTADTFCATTDNSISAQLNQLPPFRYISNHQRFLNISIGRNKSGPTDFNNSLPNNVSIKNQVNDTVELSPISMTLFIGQFHASGAGGHLISIRKIGSDWYVFNDVDSKHDLSISADSDGTSQGIKIDNLWDMPEIPLFHKGGDKVKLTLGMVTNILYERVPDSGSV